MNIKPIKNEREYNQALKEIAKLLDAPEGSPDADALELLSTLVEIYEEKHFLKNLAEKSRIEQEAQRKSETPENTAHCFSFFAPI